MTIEEHHRRAVAAARAGDRDAAHGIVQREDDPLSALIHAWLHRAEGDLSNARHWYAKAGEPMPDASLDEELDGIAARVGAGSREV